MSLTSAIQIGRSALAASQIGIQVSGNNMANAATPGYSRQVARLLPARGDSSAGGLRVGNGVLVRSVQRQVDTALQGRLWNSASDLSASATNSQIFSQVEAALGELGDHDLSSELSAFFGSWSEVGNQTPSASAVIQQGDRLAGFIRNLRNELLDQQRQIDDQVAATAERANQLLDSIAQLNRSIGTSEVGDVSANTLRDQRDQAISELSLIMDVNVIDRGGQGVDVLVGSTPVILGAQVQRLAVRRETVDGEIQVTLTSGANDQPLAVSSGSLGALLESRDTAVAGTLEKLDTLASQLIFEVNKLHGTGSSARGLTRTTGTLALGGNRGLALNDPDNQATKGLPYHATSGSFVVNVRNAESGTIESRRIDIDLDGRNNAGAVGTGDDTSAQDILDSLNAIPGLHATFTPEGQLDVRCDEGLDFSFAEDTSGAVALLGLNAYFTGTDATNIGIRADLKTDSSLLTTGRIVDGNLVENATALDIAGLQSKQLGGLAGRTIQSLWRDSVQQVGGQAASAQTASRAAAVVYDSLDAQRAGLSGVSIDEESINLLDFQRQYQAAAKIISTADEMTQILIGLL